MFNTIRSIVVTTVLVGLGTAGTLSTNPLSAADQPAREQRIKVTATDKAVCVSEGARLLLEYPFGDVPFKPYVKQLTTPGGLNPLRDNVMDHKHHHALMFAVAVDGVNFWEEGANCGSQVHRSLSLAGTKVLDDGLAVASFTEQLDWVGGPDKKTLMQEQRTIVLYRGGELGASLLTWQGRLSAPEGRDRVSLGGGHYHGLGMRFLASMDKIGKFIFADRNAPVTNVRGDETLKPSAWCAYGVKSADGKEVTAAMFDHPGNARPALWFTMYNPFSYVSATMNYWKQPLTIKAGEPLVLRYGVALWDGQAEPARIEKLYRKWLELAPKDK